MHQLEQAVARLRECRSGSFAAEKSHCGPPASSPKREWVRGRHLGCSVVQDGGQLPRSKNGGKHSCMGTRRAATWHGASSHTHNQNHLGGGYRPRMPFNQHHQLRLFMTLAGNARAESFDPNLPSKVIAIPLSNADIEAEILTDLKGYFLVEVAN
jgi:hypothetical protein